MLRLKPPKHCQQIDWGYCLPACAQMALFQLGIKVSQANIAAVLKTRSGIGTPFSRLQKLTQVSVEITEWGSLTAVNQSLNNEMAVIVAVTTSPALPGWGDFRTQHALLILNTTPDSVIYHDPYMAQGPTTASRNEFLLAWGEMAEMAAFLYSL